MEEHKSHSEHTDAKKHDMPEIPKVDFKNVNAGALKGGFTDVLAILKLDKAAMERVANRESEGITMALVYLAIGTIASALGGIILGYSFLGQTFRTPIVTGLIGAVVAVVMAAVVIYLTSLVAEKLFKGKGKFSGFFRVLGYASLLKIVGFVTIVPLLSTLASIWLLVINYMALTVVHKLDTTNAILTIIVTVVATVVVAYVIGMIGLSAVAGGGMGFSLS